MHYTLKICANITALFSSTFQLKHILIHFLYLLFTTKPIVLYHINLSLQLGLLAIKRQRDVLNNLWLYIQCPTNGTAWKTKCRSARSASFYIDISGYSTTEHYMSVFTTESKQSKYKFFPEPKILRHNSFEFAYRVIKDTYSGNCHKSRG